jgi:hypothetical protein
VTTSVRADWRGASYADTDQHVSTAQTHAAAYGVLLCGSVLVRWMFVIQVL